MRSIRFFASICAVAAAAGVLAAIATAAGAPPSYTMIPTIKGDAAQPFVGDVLSTDNGQWNGNPTSFRYQWDRCDPVGDRQGCVPIAGATKQSYTVGKGDVDHTLRVRVTATNAYGSTTKDSKGTGVVAPAAAPSNQSRPTISGTPVVGSSLTASPGRWLGATSFAYQWQSCDQYGNNCSAISGATGSSYGVRSADIGHELMVSVTASNKYGSSQASSDRTPAVSQATTPTETLTLTSPADAVVYGNSLTLSGQVMNGSAGETVTINAQPQLAGKLTQAVQTVTTGPNGGFTATVQPLLHTVYVARTSKGRSEPLAINVRPRLSIGWVAPRTIRLRVSSAVSFTHKYALIQYWNRRAGVWVSLQRIYLTHARTTVSPTIISTGVAKLHIRAHLRVRAMLTFAQARPAYISGVSNAIRS